MNHCPATARHAAAHLPRRAALLLVLLAASSQALAQQQPVTLAPVQVEGEAGVVTEGTGAWTSERATVGAKQPVDVRRVPQTVNVITRQRLDDAGANSLEDASYLLPNLTHATGNGFSGSLYSRGHEVFTYNVDGAPRPFLSLYGTAPDLYFFDRVEVLSGPSGVFQGSGEPVGTVNLVRKRAGYDFAANAAASYGSFDAARIEGDVTGPLTDDGAVRARVAGYGLDEESFIDFAQRNRKGAYGTVEFDLGAATTVSAGGIVEGQDVSAASGLPTFTNGALLALAPSTFIGAPWNRNDTRTAELFGEVEHEFANGGVFKAQTRSYERDTEVKSALASTGVDPATGNFTMFTFARNFEETTRYHDASYTAPFRLFGNRSEFTVGGDFRDSTQYFEQNFDFGLGVQNLATFDPTALIEPSVAFPGVGPGFRLNTESRAREAGAYGYVRLGITASTLLSVGARYASFHSKTYDRGRGTMSKLTANRFVPLLGISQDLTRGLSVYASYSEIFQPQSELRANATRLDPVVGRQVELGAKSALLDGRLHAQAAVYWLEDEGRAEPDPANVGFFLPSGEARTRGFEATVQGRITERLDVSIGYAHASTDLLSDPTPERNATAYARYTFRDGALRGLWLGAGVRMASQFDAVSGGVTIRAPSYTVVDAMAGYRFNDRIEAQLLVNNVLDREYVERVNEVTRGTFYGEPLNASARLRVSFD